MNTGTENNNELGISLLLVGVRGCLYIYRREEEGFACRSALGGLVSLWLCLSLRQVCFCFLYNKSVSVERRLYRWEKAELSLQERMG